MSMRIWVVAVVFLAWMASPVRAQEAPAPSEPGDVEVKASGELEDWVAAVEINVLWPFFPGGLTDLKVVLPAYRATERDWRGEVIVGLHSDFGWRSIREPDAGRVAFLGVKLGFRQFFVYGLHLDLSVNAGWRHEENNPYDGQTINAFQGRLWTMAGYQYDFTDTFYANIRGGIGVHLWRTDRFADKEKIIGGAGDVNIGFRF